MGSKIIKRSGSKITLELEVELDPNSMLNSEEQIQQAINEAANQLTGQALKQFDTDGRAIEVKDKKLTSKGRVKKNTKRPMEK